VFDLYLYLFITTVKTPNQQALYLPRGFAVKNGLIPMTHAAETGAINLLNFLAPVFDASGMKISGAENKCDRK